jgi:hypothetical protein
MRPTPHVRSVDELIYSTLSPQYLPTADQTHDSPPSHAQAYSTQATLEFVVPINYFHRSSEVQKVAVISRRSEVTITSSLKPISYQIASQWQDADEVFNCSDKRQSVSATPSPLSDLAKECLTRHNPELHSLAITRAPLPTKVRRDSEEKVLRLTTRSTTAREDSPNTIWPAYIKEAGEHDKALTDAWKENATCFVVFVSPVH